MSALPPKADIGTQSRNVRFVPKADNVAAQQFDAIPTAVDADQEADLIIRRRQRVADNLASEALIAQHELPLPVPCLRFGAGQLGAEHHAALRIGRTPDH